MQFLRGRRRTRTWVSQQCLTHHRSQAERSFSRKTGPKPAGGGEASDRIARAFADSGPARDCRDQDASAGGSSGEGRRSQTRTPPTATKGPKRSRRTAVHASRRIGQERPFTRFRRALNEKAWSKVPFPGRSSVFQGRRGDQVRAIWFGGRSARLFGKRPEKGRLVRQSPADGEMPVASTQLAMRLDADDWRMPKPSWPPPPFGDGAIGGGIGHAARGLRRRRR